MNSIICIKATVRNYQACVDCALRLKHLASHFVIAQQPFKMSGAFGHYPNEEAMLRPSYHTGSLFIGVSAQLLMSLVHFMGTGNYRLGGDGVERAYDPMYRSIMCETLPGRHGAFSVYYCKGDWYNQFVMPWAERDYQYMGTIHCWACLLVMRKPIELGYYLDVMIFREPAFELPVTDARHRNYHSELYFRLPYISTFHYVIAQSPHGLHECWKNDYSHYQNFCQRVYELDQDPEHCYPMVLNSVIDDEQLQHSLNYYVAEGDIARVLDFYLNTKLVYEDNDGAGHDVYPVPDDDTDTFSKRVCAVMHGRLNDAERQAFAEALADTPAVMMQD